MWIYIHKNYVGYYIRIKKYVEVLYKNYVGLLPKKYVGLLHKNYLVFLT